MNGGSAEGERTALAWTRSALSMAAVAGLALRFAVQNPLPVPGVFTAVVALAAAAAMAAHGRRRYGDRDRRPSAGLVRAASIGVAAIGLAATASILLAATA